MMREMKDHELELAVGGRSGDEQVGDTAAAPHADVTKLTNKYLNGVAKAAPFLLSDEPHNFARPPKKLPGAPKRQTRKGGPFTFKTPYLNR